MGNKFILKSNYNPIPAQIKSIEKLVGNYKSGLRNQVLLGVTGSGKTYVTANVVEKLQLPTLIISHNKTLAAQLYQEYRDFFPENAVSYFVSYYDYYQPEAYIPRTDTYIEKDAQINDLIDKLRLLATTNLLTRNDNIVIASVSCIYNIGSPKEYGNFVLELSKGRKVARNEIIQNLVELQYERGDFGFHRGTFRSRGNYIDIYPAYLDIGVRVELGVDSVDQIALIDTITGQVVQKDLPNYLIYPAKHFIANPEKNKEAFEEIQKDLDFQVKKFKTQGKELEAHRLKQKVTYDMEMIQQMGYVKGIENYSRYFDGRSPGDPPYSLLDYFSERFGDDWLVVADESHITFPQVRGMYAGDLSRKETLVNYGFRLPSALDNRPLRFDEFLRRIPGFLATSATPSDWELSMAKDQASGLDKKTHPVVEQLIRPTGIPDPLVEIRPIKGQVQDVIEEIKKRARKEIKERVLVTTLTKKTAEDLSEYLKEQNVKVHYVHSGVDTLVRTEILDDLRRGKYDCIVGVNLLREGLDLPEVSLVAILDADKEGFLRSTVSLTQTMGRAARHREGTVVLYADVITKSIQKALDEIKRRRKVQLAYNKKYGIVPRSIQKPIREKVIESEGSDYTEGLIEKTLDKTTLIEDISTEALTPMDRKKLISNLKKEMKIAANDLNFELAARLRDKMIELSDLD